MGSSISPGIPGEGVEGLNSLESTPAVANELLENESGLEIGGNISGSEIGGQITLNPVGPS